MNYGPIGIPDDLYDMPATYGNTKIHTLLTNGVNKSCTGVDDYVHPVKWDVWNVAATEMAKVPNDDFYDAYHQILLNDLRLDPSSDVTESNEFSVLCVFNKQL